MNHKKESKYIEIRHTSGLFKEGGKTVASGWSMDLDIEKAREICKKRGYIEYKKGVMRVIEDFLDDEILEFREGKMYKDFY